MIQDVGLEINVDFVNNFTVPVVRAGCWLGLTACRREDISSLNKELERGGITYDSQPPDDKHEQRVPAEYTDDREFVASAVDAFRNSIDYS